MNVKQEVIHLVKEQDDTNRIRMRSMLDLCVESVLTIELWDANG